MPLLALGILASGSGTNFDSIAAAIEAGLLRARIALLVCNRADAAVVKKAEVRGIPTVLLDHRRHSSRAEFDGVVADALEASGVELVVMAGFDRIVTSTLLRRFPQRVINIHPALLPSFRGTHAQAQAADYGITIAGATVHFVDEDVDHGPIIAQAAVPVAPGDDAEVVQQRILAVEHRLYPHALRLYAEGRLEIHGRIVRVRDRAAVTDEALFSPPLD